MPMVSCLSSKVCTRIGSIGRSSPGAGTYQSCPRFAALTRIDPSAPTARFSRTKCSGKLAMVVIFAREAVVIVVLLYLGRKGLGAFSFCLLIRCHLHFCLLIGSRFHRVEAGILSRYR